MRRTLRARQPLLLAALLLAPLAAPVAQAGAAGEGELASPRPPTLDGLASASASSGAVFVEATGAGAAAEAVDGSFGRVRARHVTATLRAVDNPLGGDASLLLSYRNVTFAAADGALSITPLDATFQFLAHAGEDGPLRVEASAGRVEKAPLKLGAEPFRYDYIVPNQSAYAYHYEAPAPGVPLATSAGEGLAGDGLEARLSGGVRLFVTGATVVLREGGREHVLEVGVHERRAMPEAGPLWPEYEQAYSFLVLDLAEAEVRVRADGLRGAAVLLEPEVAVEGSVRFANATGRLLVDGRAVAVADEPVVLSGLVRLTPPPVGDAGLLPLQGASARTYRVGGSFDGIQLSGVALPLDSSPVGRAGVALLAVAAGALLLRALSHVGGGAFYTRLDGARLLHSPPRKRLLGIVAARPGIHQRELQRELEMGWGSFHYHLHVLVRNGLLQVRHHGKHAHVFLPGSDGGVGGVLTGSARRIYDELPARGGVTQQELAERLSLSRQLVSHHLKALEDDGLVEAQGLRPRRYVRRDATGSA